MELISFTFLLRVGLLSVISVSGRPWHSANVLNQNGREIYYYLEKNQIYGSVISPNYKAGFDLRVGQPWEKEIGDSSYEVNCIRLYGDDVYLDEYEPVIFYYGKPPNFKYTFIHKNVWNCMSTRESDEKNPLAPIHFYRIVSVVHGIRPVNTIFYFDGIEVRRDTTSAPRKNEDSIWTYSLKEIKYIDPITRKVLRYDGKLKFLPSGKGTGLVDKMNLFEPLHVINEVSLDLLYEQPYNPTSMKETTKSKIIDTSGDILRVGQTEFTFYGQEGDEATCEKEKDVPLIYTDLYLPECSIRSGNSVFDGNFGGDVGEVNANCFTLFNQELWKCHFYREKKKWTFHRRVTEMVGAIPISKIEFSSAISVWKYRLNSKSSSVRIKEIYYHHEDDTNKQIRFNGTIKLYIDRFRGERDRDQLEENAFFYTYNPAVESALPKIIEGKLKKSVEKVYPKLPAYNKLGSPGYSPSSGFSSSVATQSAAYM